MKHFSAPRSSARTSGFTLVELLVVIAIIAILASIILAAGSAAINAAKRVRAQNLCQQFQTAVGNYYTEYSVYPTPTGAAGTGDFGISDQDAALAGSNGTGTWAALTQCLDGMISPTTGQNVAASETTFANTRQIAFMTLRSSDVGSGTGTTHQDAPLNPLPPNGTQLYLNIAIDTDYDGVIGKGDANNSSTWLPAFNPPTSGSAPPTTGTTTGGVALWCNCNPNGYQNSNFWPHTY